MLTFVAIFFLMLAVLFGAAMLFAIYVGIRALIEWATNDRQIDRLAPRPRTRIIRPVEYGFANLPPEYGLPVVDHSALTFTEIDSSIAAVLATEFPGRKPAIFINERHA